MVQWLNPEDQHGWCQSLPLNTTFSQFRALLILAVFLNLHLDVIFPSD
jgi:hypothetical protein